MQPGRYEKCDQPQTVSCLLQWRHTSYKCWFFTCAHKFIQYKNVNGGKGKWMVNNHAHQTQNLKKKVSYYQNWVLTLSSAVNLQRHRGLRCYRIYLGILCPYWLQCMVLIISVLTVLLYYFTLENKRQQSLYPRELHIKLQVSSTQVKPFVQAPSLKELEASETALRILAQLGR